MGRSSPGPGTGRRSVGRFAAAAAAAAARCLSQPPAGMGDSQARAPSCAASAAGRRQHGSPRVVLLLLCSTSVPELPFPIGTVLCVYVQHTPGQPSCAVHFTLVHAQLVCWPCWPAGPVSAVQKHAGMVREAGYPLVWYLSSALSWLALEIWGRIDCCSILETQPAGVIW